MIFFSITQLIPKRKLLWNRINPGVMNPHICYDKKISQSLSTLLYYVFKIFNILIGSVSVYKSPVYERKAFDLVCERLASIGYPQVIELNK